MEVLFGSDIHSELQNATDSSNVCLWKDHLENMNLIPFTQPLNE